MTSATRIRAIRNKQIGKVGLFLMLLFLAVGGVLAACGAGGNYDSTAGRYSYDEQEITLENGTHCTLIDFREFSGAYLVCNDASVSVPSS